MTYAVEACPCCSSTRHRAYPAVVSPFLADYALSGRPSPTRLLACDSCGFRFFEDRLTDAESGRLYAGYRGEGYYQARHRHEPWYTRKVNEALGDSAEVIGARQALVEGFLRRTTSVDALGDVLDFGGDRGQLLPASLGRRRFVYEISGLEPVAGVTRIGSAAELAGQRFDLVLLSHVLEHCSEPLSVLESVRLLLRSGESRLYVELPYERVGLGLVGTRALYRRYLAALGRAPRLLTAVDLYSTLFRTRFNLIPPLGLIKMHEHLNFFDEASVRALLRRAGLSVLSLERMVIRSTLGETSVLGALARLG